MGVKNGYFCQKCKSSKTSRFCSKCNEETLSHHTTIVTDIVKTTESIKGKIAETGKRPHVVFKAGTFSSNDERYTEGVDLSMSVDRRNNRYDQVIIDRKTGSIIHEEHEKLSEHIPSDQKKRRDNIA